ncbi:hypothetical protein [Alteromonas sp. a30]|uniref:hypothetical protein n=1 Tax=Alteromonas sp. a30 TaxID=2730917 RepID=UPI00227EB3AD|nr:hypothetical protein [Alteromonas sp. a30]MCY7295659.1 hypothetical protein [Alteromonas sp. a30]
MLELDIDGAETIRRRVKYIIQMDFTNIAHFYEHLYGVTPEKGKLQTFRNYLNRGKVNAEFLQLLAQKTRMGEIALKHLFDKQLHCESLFKDKEVD